ncbi:hypothetical protein XpiCFBP4643_17625 [Xanthomonas pisi]|uniref:Uncharacterized protein n=1 Tax=Xanthomonas pisi TaxID=56457 RepID=A0A2S7CZA7_9XANT|nr:hypothetical protein XpiCFBP4643_17625 [Xanthomonas pisi]
MEWTADSAELSLGKIPGTTFVVQDWGEAANASVITMASAKPINNLNEFVEPQDGTLRPVVLLCWNLSAMRQGMYVVVDLAIRFQAARRSAISELLK